MSVASKSFGLATKAVGVIAGLIPDGEPDPLRNAISEMGRARVRTDGPAKVTGGVLYSAETQAAAMSYAVVVGSSIAKGRIVSIDSAAAASTPGVALIMTHKNAPERKVAAAFGTARGMLSAAGVGVPVLGDDIVRWCGQPVAVVVADSFEAAREAAALIRVGYAPEQAIVSLDQARENAFTPLMTAMEESETVIGDADAAIDAAQVKVDQCYTTPYMNHNAMEPHATVAQWRAGRLYVYDTTQFPVGCRDVLAKKFGLARDQVVVESGFLGGAFGGKAAAWPHVELAAAAAKLIDRPVKLVLGRRDLFAMTGGRSMTRQRVAIGADGERRLTGLVHEALGMCTEEVFAEAAITPARHLYAAPAIRLHMQVAPLDRIQNSFMRAPGDAPGSFALESALDELAIAGGIDPLDLRLINEPKRNPTKGTMFSSRHLVECLTRGAEAFGWRERQAAPRSVRDGRTLIGYGMASAIHPTAQLIAKVGLTLRADGLVLIETSTSEIGTGTATAQAQATAERIGVAFDRVRFVEGNTRLPNATTPGGSSTSVTLGAAIRDAQKKLIRALLTLERGSGTVLDGAKAEDCDTVDGGVYLRNRPGAGERFEAILARAGRMSIAVEGSCAMSLKGQKYSMHAYGAHFCEVRVDMDTGEVRVVRWTGVMDGGRILNPTLARSQIIGGIIMGIGMALHEESVTDARSGGIINADLAGCHIPCHADAPRIDVSFLDRSDPMTPLGAKGIGELGIVGAAAAVANAVHHATGVRVRDLPITPDKVLRQH